MKNIMNRIIRKLPALFVGVGFIIFTAACARITVEDDALIGTKINKVGSATKLSELIELSKNSGPAYGSEENVATPGAPTDQATEDSGRNYVDTNNQVDGVNEGDIIKTDGYKVFYAPRYMNRINVFDVDDDYVIDFERVIDLENVYTDSLYLTEDYLVIVGYSYEEFASNGTVISGGVRDMWIEPYWYAPTGTVLVIDRTDYSVAYQLKTNSLFMDHRMINDSIFLVGHHYIYETDDDLRPSYEENGSAKSYLDYSDIFYFEDTPVYGMTVLTGIKLDDDKQDIAYNSSAYLGASYGYKQLYVSLTNLYISESNYFWSQGKSYQTLTISQFELDIDNASTTYVGATLVKGAMLNQFSMDEYEGYLRVATTDRWATWNQTSDYYYTDYQTGVINHLYVLKLNTKQNDFDLIAHVDEGLGKPNESIQSVRFNGPQAYIVTFLRTDPLYIIDLTTPSNPIFTGEVELPGYDTYQHPWGQNNLLGIGYQADSNGFVTGMKMTAYDTSGSGREIQTFDLSSSTQSVDENESSWSYSYSEALWNHKALLVSVEHGLFGFPVQAYEYGYTTIERQKTREWAANDASTDVAPPPTSTPGGETSEDEVDPEEPEVYYDYYWTYHSYYYLFKIDFSMVNPIPKPIIIEHPANDNYYVSVDRAVMIEGFVYTFSDQRVVTYDLNENQLVSPALIIPQNS